jgi:molybdopterin biosynthesis enzyme MoaB
MADDHAAAGHRPRAAGQREDSVIPEAQARLAGSPLALVVTRIISDDREGIERELRALVDNPEI